MSAVRDFSPLEGRSARQAPAAVPRRARRRAGGRAWATPCSAVAPRRRRHRWDRIGVRSRRRLRRSSSPSARLPRTPTRPSPRPPAASPSSTGAPHRPVRAAARREGDLRERPSRRAPDHELLLGIEHAPLRAPGERLPRRQGNDAGEAQGHIHYHVTVLFGVVPPAAEGAPPQPAQLTTYSDIALTNRSPARQPQLVFSGVAAEDRQGTRRSRSRAKRSCTGKPPASRARRSARRSTCSPDRPRRSKCREANGSPVTYELKIVSITKA